MYWTLILVSVKGVCLNPYSAELRIYPLRAHPAISNLLLNNVEGLQV